MGYSKLEIKTKGQPPQAFTEVYIDGHLIHGVRSYELKHDAKTQLPILTLDLNALDVSVDSLVDCVRQAGGYRVGFDFGQGEPLDPPTA